EDEGVSVVPESVTQPEVKPPISLVPPVEHIQMPARQATIVEAPVVQKKAVVEIRSEDIPRLNSIITGGMNQAGAVLSQLLGAKVDVSVPEYQAIDFKRLKDFLPRDPVVGVLISTEPPFESMLLLVFDEETGYRAAADLMGMPASAAKDKSIAEE